MKRAGPSRPITKFLQQLTARHVLPVAVAVSFAAGASVALIASDLLRENGEGKAAHEPGEWHQGLQGFVNPLLECWTGESLNPITQELEDRVETYIAKAKSEKRAKHVSVYFRDLNNGPWFGIDEKEKFVPGSLLKVPVMVEFLKEAESRPEILAQRVRYEAARYADINFSQLIKPTRSLTDGEDYSIEELIRYMIVHSDNASTYLLIDTEFGEKTLKPCRKQDARVPCKGILATSVSVKDYAGLFRILYNASYMGKAMSNRALELLNQIDFKDGLVAGVPVGVQVAHKFGERGEKDGTQFHDCGIVYYPRRNYLLCVMTRGDNLGSLIGVVRELSSIVYKGVDQLGSESQERGH